MKTTQPLKRRSFLAKTAGLAGLSAGLESLAQLLAAEPGKTADSHTDNLKKLIDELSANDSPLLRFPTQDGRFLRLLVKAMQTKNVLEIGTAHGYATLWMRSGLEATGGQLTTLDIRPDRVQKAKTHMAKAGMAERVTFKVGDAHKLVAGLEGPFDLIFLNADKSGTLDYFQKLYPQKCPPGGLLLAYSAVLMRDSMEDYLEMISHHADFDSLILSATMEDGFSLSWRHRK